MLSSLVSNHQEGTQINGAGLDSRLKNFIIFNTKASNEKQTHFYALKLPCGIRTKVFPSYKEPKEAQGHVFSTMKHETRISRGLLFMRICVSILPDLKDLQF